ncbi:hypothetical protein GOP47_0026732 [Adiantum capillus-veneris]|nr:hypothetical protein GOP47_0026732 [Adiantum capillus-veneris]
MVTTSESLLRSPLLGSPNNNQGRCSLSFGTKYCHRCCVFCHISKNFQEYTPSTFESLLQSPLLGSPNNQGRCSLGFETKYCTVKGAVSFAKFPKISKEYTQCIGEIPVDL